MRETNYTRQITRFMLDLYKKIQPDSAYDQQTRNAIQMARAATYLANQGVKFILPDGGEVIEDREFKSFPFGNVKLPFPVVTIEYFEPTQNTDKECPFAANKRVVVLQSVKDDSGEFIAIWPIWFKKETNAWVFQDPIRIPCDISPDEVRWDSKNLFVARTYLPNQNTGAKYSSSDYIGEIATAFSFLSALGCSNVMIEKPDNKRKSTGKSSGDALPFDEYHVLSIQPRCSKSYVLGNSHRSPREHLRRGHIRHLANGEKIWVNACVVNAGTHGRVSKSYMFHN